MNKILLKEICILSLILGFVSGALVMLPIVGIAVMLALFFLSSVIIYFYMKKRNELGLFEPKEAALYGAAAGFVSFIGFCFVMIPLALIFGQFIKMGWFSFVKQVFSLGVISGAILIVMLALFVAVMCAMSNAFTAMVAVYLMQDIEGTNKNKDDMKIDLEIK